MHALAQSVPGDLTAPCEALALPAVQPSLRPERVLERLLDLPRSVALGAVLDYCEQSAPPTPLPPEQREAELAMLGLFEARLVRRLGELRAQLEKQLSPAARGGRTLPTAAELCTVLAELHADQATPKQRQAAAARLSSRCAAVTSGALGAALKELGWLHQALREQLLQGSPHSRRLAALDETLDASIRAELEKCRTRLEPALAAGLQAKLTQALEELATGAPQAGVQALFARDGCIGEFLRASQKLSGALLELEWDALMGLLQAALEPLRAAPCTDQAPHEETTP